MIQAIPEARPNSDNIILIHSPRKGERRKKIAIVRTRAGLSAKPPRLLAKSTGAPELVIDVARLYQYIVAPC